MTIQGDTTYKDHWKNTEIDTHKYTAHAKDPTDQTQTTTEEHNNPTGELEDTARTATPSADAEARLEEPVDRPTGQVAARNPRNSIATTKKAGTTPDGMNS
jgi:hypothetical protein